MQVTESLRVGIAEIRMHKMRSFLTMLGVICGIAAVIGVSAIGAGASAELQKQLALLGTNTVRVRAVEMKGAAAVAAQRQSPFGLTLGDVAAIREVVPDVTRIAPVKQPEDLQAVGGGKTLQADIVGAGPDLPRIVGYAMDQGRFLTEADVVDIRAVAVIGAEIRRVAFPLEDPLGKTVVVEGTPFTVVGVLRPRGSGGGETVIDVGSVDRQIIVPVTSVLSRLLKTDPREHRLDEVVMQVSDSESLGPTSVLVQRLLSRRHRGAPDFEIIVPEELIRQQQQAEQIFQNVLLFVAAISLLVGGIGIMNIMLATVTQRTREIGIRRALGATRRDVLGQFLIEALIISLLGGIIGIGIGYAMAFGMQEYVGYQTFVPIPAVVVATAVAGGVGVVFGFYPSYKAANLDPIEALRTE